MCNLLARYKVLNLKVYTLVLKLDVISYLTLLSLEDKKKDFLEEVLIKFLFLI